MIDLFAVVSLGGFVRWSFVSHKFDHLQLINTVMNHISTSSISGQVVGESELAVGNNLLKWFINEDLELVYILAHPKMFPLDWSAALFKKMDAFVATNFAESLGSDQFLELEDGILVEKFKEVTRKEEVKAKESKKLLGNPQGKAKGNNPKITAESAETSRRSWTDKASKNDLKALDFSANSKTEREIEAKNLSIDDKSKLDDPSDDNNG